MRMENVHRLTQIAVNLMKIMVIVHHAIMAFKFRTTNAFLQNNKKLILTVTSLKMDSASNVRLVFISMKSVFALKFQMIVLISMKSLEFVLDATLVML